MAKTITNKSCEKDNLAKELKSLIPKLDEEGLAFLVKQAHVHLYNMQVDALNQTIIKEEQRKSSTAAKNKKTVKDAGFKNIKITASGCHIQFRNQWISFTNSEITALVKIAKGKGADLEIRGRLFTWLARERKDLLNTASIANKFDDNLKPLISLLKKLQL
ncbi:MAG: hypothetical protein LBC80_01035 [Treponema sp.]|jgi:hypothetical protein|nr:hypothetical protein [Treponema sp.]